MAILSGPSWGPATPGPARQLIVLCHGLGADGHDLIDLATIWGRVLPYAAFVAPDAPEPCDMGPYGRQWFSVADRTPARIADGAAMARAALDAFIDAELTRLGLASDAYGLMGFSQGAMTALYTGLRRETPPRGILAFSGALIAPDRLAEATAHAPILLVHGEEDDIVPVDRSRHAQAALEAAGFDVTTIYCPRLGHGIDDAGLSAGSLFLQRVFSLPAPSA